MRAVVSIGTKTEKRDGYLKQLGKFIPGEVTAAYTALALAAVVAAESMSDTAPPNWLIWIVFGIGLLATPGYWAVTTKKDEERVTGWWGYLFAAVAFVPWSLAISSPTRDAFGVTVEVAEFLLVLTAFALPLLNAGATKVFGK